VKEFSKSALNLLGSSSIDNRIEYRRHQHVQVSQEDVHMLGNLIVTKAVGEEGEEGRDIENKDDTNVGATGAQRLVLGITGWETKDSMENKAIGDGNEDGIKTHGQESHGQPINNIDSDVGTGQSSNAHVLTVSVSHDTVATVGQSPQQEDEWGDNSYTTEYSNRDNLAYDLMIENGCVSQWVADSHIPVKGHGKKDRGLQSINSVNTKHLGQAPTKRNLTNMQPQNGQHFRHSGRAESQVSE
jgi:hypothetical protein